jgi:hypothetical protein
MSSFRELAENLNIERPDLENKNIGEIVRLRLEYIEDVIAAALTTAPSA